MGSPNSTSIHHPSDILEVLWTGSVECFSTAGKWEVTCMGGGGRSLPSLANRYYSATLRVLLISHNDIKPNRNQLVYQPAFFRQPVSVNLSKYHNTWSRVDFSITPALLAYVSLHIVYCHRIESFSNLYQNRCFFSGNSWHLFENVYIDDFNKAQRRA